MQDRGHESTGVAFIDSGRLAIVKRPVSATQFVNNRRFQNLMQEDAPLIIGHTRYATQGGVTKRNAHPFLRGDIVGVHNGIVYNTEDFKKFSDTLQVDSELIFNLLNDSHNDYRKSFKKLSGSFAIAWTRIQKDDYELFLVRDGNPLYVAYIAELKSYFYCSTEEALKAILLSHYSEVKIRDIHECGVINIKSDLSTTEDMIEFKSYYNFNRYSKLSKRYRKISMIGDEDGGYGEDDIELAYDDGVYTGEDNICPTCHEMFQYCYCKFPNCDDCGTKIYTVYWIIPTGTKLCQDCYEYKKIKGTKYSIDY